MKLILYMTTSLDGKTTRGEDDTSWVEEAEIARFDAEMIRCGVMIMGRKTYESFGDDLPVGKALLVVMTHDLALLDTHLEGVIFTDDLPVDVLEMLKTKGYIKAMLTGGEDLNSSFLKDGLIDEVRVILKPLVIGEGKSLFRGSHFRKAELVKNEQLPTGAIELTYRLK